MKRCVDTTLLAFLLLLSSCNGKNKTESAITGAMVTGHWQCNIESDNFQGVNTLYFSSDSCFKDTQLRNYTINDSGFKCTVTIQSDINGKWSLKQDSLILRYDIGSLTFSEDTASYNLLPLNPDADLIKLEIIEEDMRNTLLNHLENGISGQYSTLSDRNIPIGKIEKINGDTMLIKHDSTNLLLIKRH